MSDSKKPIFLLKTKNSPQDGYEEYFSAPNSQFNPIFVPVLEHKLNTTNLHKVRDLFISGDITRQYGGLVFTSQRAVEGFTKMIQTEVGESKTIESSRFLNFYTVGPATYHSLGLLRDSHFPHAELIGQEAGTGQILAGMILDHYNKNHARNRQPQSQDNSNKLPLLFLVGEVHRDIIPKTLSSSTLPVEERIEIHELIVYETDVMASFETDFKSAIEKEKAKKGENQDEVRWGDGWVVVFSPTGCGAMLNVLGLGRGQKPEDRARNRVNYRIATIGPTTRDHLIVEFGVGPDVCAAKPSPDGVGRGIEKYLEGLGIGS